MENNINIKKGIKNKFMFVDKQGYIMGVSIDSYLENDYFWQMEEYVLIVI
ncbi:hypothetical protein [Spiroplasma sp. ChiS]|nr:hypothetical protein [Spiroplasma sp. ChiS]